MRQVINTNKAPQAIGPYAQAIKTESFVFTAGQIAIDPNTNAFINEDVATQTRQVLENLKAVVEASGSSLANALKTTVYLTEPENFAPMNEIYGQYFKTEPPSRTTIFVKALPKNALVEIDVIVQL
jgi:2-iminobutanoate/2-iminopropanoate deaminase